MTLRRHRYQSVVIIGPLQGKDRATMDSRVKGTTVLGLVRSPIHPIIQSTPIHPDIRPRSNASRRRQQKRHPFRSPSVGHNDLVNRVVGWTMVVSNGHILVARPIVGHRVEAMTSSTRLGRTSARRLNSPRQVLRQTRRPIRLKTVSILMHLIRTAPLVLEALRMYQDQGMRAISSFQQVDLIAHRLIRLMWPLLSLR